MKYLKAIKSILELAFYGIQWLFWIAIILFLSLMIGKTTITPNHFEMERPLHFIAFLVFAIMVIIGSTGWEKEKTKS